MAQRRERTAAPRSTGGGKHRAKQRIGPKRGRRPRPRPPLSLDAVIEAARELLAEEGLESLSLRGVAARVGVTAPALYAHVDDKLDLMRKLGEDGFQRLIEGFAPIPHSDALMEIRAIAKVYLDFARRNPQQFRVMFLFPAPVTGPPEPDSLRNSARAYAVATDAVTRAIDAGLLEASDPGLTTLTIWTAVHGVTMQLVIGRQFSHEIGDRLMESLVVNLLRGMARGSEAEPTEVSVLERDNPRSPLPSRRTHRPSPLPPRRDTGK